MLEPLEKTRFPEQQSGNSTLGDGDAQDYALGELTHVRHILVDRVWTGILVIILIGVPLSISRAAVTGWMPLYSAHIAIGAVGLGIYLSQKWLSFQFKAASIFALFWAVGLAGLIQMGPFGAGLWWLSITPFIASALYSIRAGIYTMGFVLLTVAVIGGAYVMGILSSRIEPASYESSPQAWATLLVGACLMPLVVFHAISLLTRQVIELAIRQHKSETILAKQRDQLEKLAFQDELTGLPTRRIMMDRLQQKIRSIQRSHQKAALLSIDLNGFKGINDTLGHAAGDQVLKYVAERITALLRPGDTVSRFGGDEFVVLIDLVQDPVEATQIGERIVAGIRNPMMVRGSSLEVGASVGIAIIPDDGERADALLETSDRAMYQRKAKRELELQEPRAQDAT